MNDLINVSTILFKRIYIKSFIHGAIEEKKALKLVEKINSNFTYDPIINVDLKDYKNYHADLTGYYIYREQMRNIYNVNHATMNLYQLGLENINNTLFANIVKEMCSYIYFNELRIKQQLGYIVKGKVFAESNTLVQIF